MRKSRYFLGLLFLFCGFILLLSNVQIYGLNALNYILSIPLIIIGFLILLGIISKKKPGMEQISTPLENIKEAYIEINHETGNLAIHSISSNNKLLIGEFNGGINYDVVTIEDRAYFKLRIPTESNLRKGLWKYCSGTRLDWDIGLNSQIKISLHLVNKTDTIDLNLANLHLEEISLDLAANNAVIRLPHNLNNLKIKSLISIVEVIVPKDRQVSIQVENGINMINIDRERFSKERRGRYQSIDYEGSENQIEIIVETNLSMIKIR